MKKNILNKIKKEIESNSYNAENHENNEVVIKTSRAIEIIIENSKLITTKKIQSEKIIRIWRFSYAKLFDEMDDWDLKDKKGKWMTHKLLWRFYWLTPNV